MFMIFFIIKTIYNQRYENISIDYSFSSWSLFSHPKNFFEWSFPIKSIIEMWRNLYEETERMVFHGQNITWILIRWYLSTFDQNKYVFVFLYIMQKGSKNKTSFYVCWQTNEERAMRLNVVIFLLYRKKQKSDVYFVMMVLNEQEMIFIFLKTSFFRFLTGNSEMYLKLNAKKKYFLR
jgi:hypothetical protein